MKMGYRVRLMILIMLLAAAVGVGVALSLEGSVPRNPSAGGGVASEDAPTQPAPQEDEPEPRPDAGVTMSAVPIPSSSGGRNVTAAAMSSRGVVALGTTVGHVRIFPPGETTFRKGVNRFADRSRVADLAVSGDGSTVAALTESGWLGGWRLDSQEVYVLPPPSDMISSLALSSDGRYLAVADFNISIYDLEHERRIATFEQPVATGGIGQYEAVRFDPSATAVVAARLDGFDAWKLAMRRRTGCDCAVGDGAGISHNAQYVIFGTANNHATLWDTRARRELADLTVSSRPGHTYAAQIGDDGRNVVAGSSDGTVVVWRSPDQTIAPTTKQFAREPIVGLELTSRGDRLLVEAQLPDDDVLDEPPGSRRRWLVTLR